MTRPEKKLERRAACRPDLDAEELRLDADETLRQAAWLALRLRQCGRAAEAALAEDAARQLREARTLLEG